MAKPTCMLCRGDLVCLKKVSVFRHEHGIECHLAWVCTTCSAAYPIAVHNGLLKAVPLYEDGKAYDE
ncbi:MAG: hypothetical protein ABI867_34690 [Kofleriaceae bacterium]